VTSHVPVRDTARIISQARVRTECELSRVCVYDATGTLVGYQAVGQDLVSCPNFTGKAGVEAPSCQ
jgi:hypothetical protein